MVEEVLGLARCSRNRVILRYLFVLEVALFFVLGSSCAVGAAFPTSIVSRDLIGFVRREEGSVVVDSISKEWRSREQKVGSDVGLDSRGRFDWRITGEGEDDELVWQAKQQREEEGLTRAGDGEEHPQVLQSRGGGEEEAGEGRWSKADEQCNNFVRSQHSGTRHPASATGQGEAFSRLRTRRNLAAADVGGETGVLLKWRSSLIDGPKKFLLNWNTSVEPDSCLWKGVECRNFSQVQRVVAINLAGGKISGSISPGLGGLPFLATLNLSYNRLDGRIPGDLVNVSSLQAIDLRFNRLNGTMPAFCGNSSSSLRSLSLNKNKLTGVIPSSLRQCQQLTSINLARNKLAGAIPAGLTNLPNLQELILSRNRLVGPLPTFASTAVTNISLDWNQFYGSIPAEYGSLERLEGLYLNDNRLSGTLEDWVAELPSLSELHLNENSFGGEIPSLLGNSQQLTSLVLANNSFVGGIPLALVVSQNLVEIDLSGNQLNDSIPEAFGFLAKLEQLYLQQNYLTGTIPTNLTSCVQLTDIDLSDNQLNGSIPSLDSFLKLRTLRLNSNQLTGSIPSVTNCKNLTVLHLSNNGLSGHIPDNIGQVENLTSLDLSHNSLLGPLPELGGLTHLQTLNLQYNQFNEALPRGVWQLKNLSNLGLSGNSFEGSLPDELGDLIGLQSLELQNNVLSGPIPAALGKLVQLQVLALGSNHFVGGIPSNLSHCTNLTSLTLNNNGLNGSIPESLGQLQSLQVLHLQGNKLSGTIPGSFTNFRTIQDFDISNNELTGDIPRTLLESLSALLEGNFSLANNRMNGPLPQELGLLTKVQTLNLSGNSFSNGIPIEIGNCSALLRLDLSENNLTGEIPTSVGKLSSLQLLNVSHNHLNGSIPGAAVGQLVQLVQLDLSFNNFSGEIPSSLVDLTSLSFLNLSYNLLQGPVPDNGSFRNFPASAFLGNPGLCGPILLLSCSAPSPQKDSSKGSLSTAAKVGIAAGVVGFVALVAVALCIGWRLAHLGRIPEKRGSIIARSELFYPQLTFTVQDLRLATENFSDVNTLGTGSLSKVYRGVLPELVLVAVKKLRVPDGTEILSDFLQELDELGRLRYRHLVAILGYCFEPEMSALVVQFMSNGSLEDHLHVGPTCDLDWPTRAKVGVGVAKALNYLHHDCGSVIVHCDLKPSNVLLDAEYEAHLEDFGLSRLIFAHKLMDMTNSSVGSSVGYFPPEYAQSPTVSTKGDVYSFGILLLELLTGKKPTEDMFKDDVTLTTWCQDSFPNKISDVLDPTLVGSKETSQKQVLLFMKVALMCAKVAPEERPTMKSVLELLR